MGKVWHKNNPIRLCLHIECSKYNMLPATPTPNARVRRYRRHVDTAWRETTSCRRPSPSVGGTVQPRRAAGARESTGRALRSDDPNWITAGRSGQEGQRRRWAGSGSRGAGAGGRAQGATGDAIPVGGRPSRSDALTNGGGDGLRRVPAAGARRDGRVRQRRRRHRCGRRRMRAFPATTGDGGRTRLPPVWETIHATSSWLNALVAGPREHPAPGQDHRARHAGRNRKSFAPAQRPSKG